MTSLIHWNVAVWHKIDVVMAVLRQAVKELFSPEIGLETQLLQLRRRREENGVRVLRELEGSSDSKKSLDKIRFPVINCEISNYEWIAFVHDKRVFLATNCPIF